MATEPKEATVEVAKEVEKVEAPKAETPVPPPVVVTDPVKPDPPKPEPKKDEPTPILNPRITSVVTEIRNKETLLNLAATVKRIVIPKEPPVPPKPTDWFSETDVTNIAESNLGSCFTIDVQPDMRFPFSYFAYSSVKSYPELVLTPQPYVSIFTVTAYQQIAMAALLLAHDNTERNIKSFQAENFLEDRTRKEYFNFLLDLCLPSDTSLLLEQLPAVIDPVRHGLEFVPTFAAMSFAHDYGRLVPPSIMIILHNIISQITGNPNFEETMRRFYNTPVISVNARVYVVSHFIGGYFQNTAEAGPRDHQNWLKSLIEEIAYRTVSSLQAQRPRVAPITRTTFVHPTANVPAYDLMLLYQSANLNQIKEVLGTISAYIKKENASAIPLRTIFSRLGGITPLIHTIEPLSLPTWHYEFPPTLVIEDPPQAVSDNEFAARTHFMSEAPEYQHALPYPVIPPDQRWNPTLYLVDPDIPVPPQVQFPDPYHFHTFDPEIDVYPDVLIFSPYEQNVSRTTVAITLGLKIVAEEFDGLTIPLPNPEISLFLNNSHYIQGSIPITHIQPVIPSTVARNRIRIMERFNHTVATDPLGFAFRTMSFNALPTFNRAHGFPANLPIKGSMCQPHHVEPARAFTQTSWSANEEPPFPLRSRKLWSTYRYVRRIPANEEVYFYFTLQGLFGTQYPISRTDRKSVV